MKKPSIGVRLTFWYLAIFAFAQLIFGVGMWFVLRQNLYELTDDALRDQVEDMQNFLRAQDKDASVAKMQEEVTEAYVLEHSGEYMQVFAADGELIYRSSFLQQHRLPPLQLNPGGDTPFQDRQFSEKSFRFLSQKVDAYGHAYTIETGLPTQETLKALGLFRGYLLMIAPLVLLVAAGGGYWLSGRALAPVDLLTCTARTITGNNLSSRLETLDTGDELQRLSETLNEMLARIEIAFQRVTQFTADASHELRTPISLIRTESELALRRSRSDEEYRRALANILHESERTSSMIEELLSLARADSGQELLNIQKIDLCEILREVARDWGRVAASRNLTFGNGISEDQPIWISGDSIALRRLLNILLDNAVKYTPGPGTIELRTTNQSDTVVIIVQDTGVGVSVDDQPRIFERFYRADKARSRELGGAGLGLSIAQWIAHHHQGSIRVESVLGQGSSFLVELPLESYMA
jgi:heavy metal sensor kinase